MASMLENTPLDLAVAAYLLRAYGFSNKTVYELLGDNGFDVSIYAPAAGSTGGTGDKNLNKQLFIPKTRDRVGGARGSPSWLPAGERMADWLAQQIGFADETAMEEYTVEQVGSLNFTPAVTMGGYASGSAQRNLTKSHWDWTGTNSASAVGGDTGTTLAHNMGDALNDVRSTNAFNLAGLTGNAPSPTAPAPTPPTPPAPAPPAPAPVAPPSPPPVPPVVPDDDDDLPAIMVDEIEIDMTSPEEALPLPDEIPAPVTTPAPPAPPVGRKLNVDIDMAPPGTTRGPGWLKPMSVESLPKSGSASRNLNEGTWESRDMGTGGGAFPNMPTTDGQAFYPAVGPIYIVLDSWFAGKDFGPADDMTIRSMTSPAPGEDSYFSSAMATPHRQMVIGLQNGKQPAYYLFDGNDSSGSISLTGWPGVDKLQNTLSGDDRSQGVGDSSTKVAGLQIDWSDPRNGTSFPRRVRFILAKPGSKGGAASTLKFELTRSDSGEYRLETMGGAGARPNPVFATTTSDLFREIELHVDGIDSGSITQERSEMAQQIGFDSDVAEEFRTVSRMVPSDNNPNFSGEAAIIFNDQGLSPEDQDIIVYGIASSGVSGPGVFSISDSGVISASSSSSSPLPRAQILGQSLIFPNRARVYTSVDQYIGTNDESEILAREELSWETSPDVAIVWDVNDPSTSSNILSMQLEFQDASDTVTDYSGIVPDEPNAPRVQRIYIPGDIPSILTPVGIPVGSTLMRVMGYPKGRLAMQRIRADFLKPDGTLESREFPDASNRMSLQYSTPVGVSNVLGKVVMQDADDGSSGYVLLQALPAEFNGDSTLFISQIIKGRRMSRASDLNLVLPTGSTPGVRQVVWRDGGSINILVPNPSNPSEMILLNMILEDSLE